MMSSALFSLSRTLEEGRAHRRLHKHLLFELILFFKTLLYDAGKMRLLFTSEDPIHYGDKITL